MVPTLRAGFRTLIRSFLDVAFPPVCVSCGRLRADGEEFLCGSCRNSMTRVGSGNVLYGETAERLRAGGLIDDLVVPYLFVRGEALQDLIHELKYGGMRSVGVALGTEIGGLVAARFAASTIDTILPVPLHCAKFRERGYNQSAALCRGISAATGIPVADHLLRRRRYTATQTALTAAGRLENVQDAFGVNSREAAMLRNAAVLLVDDVITTGATVRECARTLRSAGCRSVVAACAAIAS